MIIESKKTRKQHVITYKTWERMAENDLQRNFKVIDASDLIINPKPVDVFEHIRAVKAYPTEGMKAKEAIQKMEEMSEDELQRVIEFEPRITIKSKAEEIYGNKGII
jgi:predicted PilT family ATPase